MSATGPWDLQSVYMYLVHVLASEVQSTCVMVHYNTVWDGSSPSIVVASDWSL